jgi:hypothetical protein
VSCPLQLATCRLRGRESDSRSPRQLTRALDCARQLWPSVAGAESRPISRYIGGGGGGGGVGGGGGGGDEGGGDEGGDDGGDDGGGLSSTRATRLLPPPEPLWPVADLARRPRAACPPSRPAALEGWIKTT